MSELPKGWTNTALENVASWGSGGTPSRANPTYFGGTIPWIKTGELGQRFVFTTEEKLTSEGVANSSAKMFSKGSVAIAMYGATIGKTSILGIDATTNQACGVGTPFENITTSAYLYYYLSSQKEAFIEAGKGGAQPNISQTVIKSWIIPLAPYSEQKRIADKLDIVLARVDACRERLNRVPLILKRFRQSVLAAATSGKLTEDWRSDANSIVKSETTTGEIGSEIKGWKLVSLSEVCHSIADGDHQAPPQATSGIPFITISSINDGKLNIDKASRYVSREYFEQLKSSRKPEIGDVLYSVTGSICIPALITEKLEFTFQRHIAILKPDLAKISSKYLYFVLGSERIRKQGFEKATGTAQLTLSLKSLRGLNVFQPPIEEQTEIVRRVETLFAFADRLEARLANASAAADKLTPALLAKAFRGELLPQDPNDEPASALLQRLAQANAGKEKASRAKRGAQASKVTQGQIPA